MKKKKIKPTIKDVATTVIRLQQVQTELIEWVQNIQTRLDMVDNTLGAYLQMNKHGKKLTTYIEKEIIKREKEEKDVK